MRRGEWDPDATIAAVKNGEVAIPPVPVRSKERTWESIEDEAEFPPFHLESAKWPSDKKAELVDAIHEVRTRGKASPPSSGE